MATDTPPELSVPPAEVDAEVVRDRLLSRAMAARQPLDKYLGYVGWLRHTARRLVSSNRR